MLLPVLSLSTLAIFSLLTRFAQGQGRENQGYGVLDPSLTGVRPGNSSDQVTYWATNDPSFVDPGLFQQQMVDIHNRYRSEHGVQSISWNPSLVATSQQLVDSCVYGHSAAMSNSATPYGENILFGFSNVTAGVQVWGDERVQYAAGGYYTNGRTCPVSLMHFTQIVWRQTTTLGCARKKCIADQLGTGSVQEQWYVCCHYAKRGNVLGEFKDNVYPQGTPV